MPNSDTLYKCYDVCRQGMVIRRSSDDAQPFGDPRPLGRAYRLVVPTRIEGGDVHASFFAVRLEAGRVEPNRLLRVSGLI